MPPFQDLTGKRFSRLLVVSYVGKSAHKRPKTSWLCICDCGKETVVISGTLNNGTTRSCGCLKDEMHIERIYKHGSAYTSEYRIWQDMKSRCLNPNSESYKYYGGRHPNPITICERWQNNFQVFLADVGRRPSLKHSLDRIDNLRGYEPGNVRWATSIQQMRNMSRNRIMTINGVSKTVAEWSEITGISYPTLCGRLQRGWDDEHAINFPIAKENTITYIIEAFGESKCLAEWARDRGMAKSTLRNRLYRGMAPEEALTAPIVSANRIRKSSPRLSKRGPIYTHSQESP